VSLLNFPRLFRLPLLPPTPDPSQIPEPQIAYALHAVWDPDLTNNNPSVCITLDTVAIPSFPFYAGWKDGAPAFFSVDWVLIEELTSDHEPQVWLFGNLQGESGFPYCTMPPVSDPESWNWTTFSFAPMVGFALHNASYRITVQWRYGVYMKGARGPFQTSITINVQNLVVTSPDVGRVLRWDPFIGPRPMIIIKEVYPCKVCNGMGYTAKTWPEDKLSLNPPKTTEMNTNKIPKSIKDQVNALGNERGCHSCGTRTPGTSDGHWIPDHVPPVALSSAIVKQFFGLTKLEIPDYPPGGWYLLPHCKFCASKQGRKVKYIKYELIDIVKKQCTRHKQ